MAPSTNDEEKSAREAMEKSRVEVMECEKEIQSIKSALKSLPMSTDSSSSMNALRVSVHKVTPASGIADASDDSAKKPTTFKVNISSPIEERTITQLYDPLNPNAEESFVTFKQVETSNALLTIEAFGEGKNSLGVSGAHDLFAICEACEEKKVTSIEFAIVSQEDGTASSATTDPVETEKENPIEPSNESPLEEKGEAEEAEQKMPATDETGEEEAAPEGESESTNDGEEPASEGTSEKPSIKDTEIGEETPPKEEQETSKPSDDKPAQVDATETEKSSAALEIPVCTLTVQLEYTPSPNDKRDALYDKLNKVSKRKSAAIETLRKSAATVNRANSAESSKEKDAPAVKSGFLNKGNTTGEDGKGKSEKAATPFWKRWYEKTLGPTSLLWVIGPIAKNYVLFFGCAAFFHFKGDLLALPPPV